jgi:Family of unknown function (DUF6131)
MDRAIPGLPPGLAIRGAVCYSRLSVDAYYVIATITSLSERTLGDSMILLGVILMIIGLVAAIPILWTIGIILLVVGLILALAGAMGHAIGGRAHYY